jgi:hypothetical protein
VYLPRITGFADATDGGYSVTQILDMERRIMQVLQFKLHPVTMSHWAGWYMNMWDIY